DEIKRFSLKDVSEEGGVFQVGFSSRIVNALCSNGIYVVDQLQGYTEEHLSTFKNIGEKSIEEIKKKLAEMGKTLG
ncbi:MAG TPA: hypothetical protein DCM59_01000, partial [Clostridium sp.]|nr:hypothetical protein [Clostridium sp.]